MTRSSERRPRRLSRPLGSTATSLASSLSPSPTTRTRAHPLRKRYVRWQRISAKERRLPGLATKRCAFSILIDSLTLFSSVYAQLPASHMNLTFPCAHRPNFRCQAGCSGTASRRRTTFPTPMTQAWASRPTRTWLRRLRRLGDTITDRTAGRRRQDCTVGHRHQDLIRTDEVK